MKQLLIYENITPISSKEHAKLSIESVDELSFTKDLIAVPLMASEFISAVCEFVIVFAGEGKEIAPYAVLGVKENENLYLQEDGTFSSKYVPAFIRRYPFVFSSPDEGENLTLCIDTSYKGCNFDGRGDALFDAAGGRTDHLNRTLEFMEGYDVEFHKTKAFCEKIAELDILEPLTANMSSNSGEELSLTGFYGINRNKVKELSSDALKSLAITDSLELLYLQMLSINNFELLIDRV